MWSIHVCVWGGVCLCVYVCMFVFVQVVRLTWTLLDAESSIGVLCPRVMLQLEGGRVVDKWLRALGHTCPTVIKVGAGLQTST